MRAIRVEEMLDTIITTFHDDADWEDPWQRVICAGLFTAKKAAVSARFKIRSDDTGLDRLNDAYEETKKKG